MKTLKRCRTFFLGWDRPLLHSAVDWLWNTRQLASTSDVSSPIWRLDDLLVVLPTRRAGRCLRQRLHQRATQANATLLPPRIITVGELPEYLYDPDLARGRGADRDRTARIPADEIERTLAWATVLEKSSPQTLATVFPRMPAWETFAVWMELAATLRQLQEDLASSNLTFADVAEELASDAHLQSEHDRWQTLQQLYLRYQQTLAQAGRSDRYVSRREAVEQGRCRCSLEVLLIGTSDLSDSLLQMLRQLGQTGAGQTGAGQTGAGQTGDGLPGRAAVTALIAADETYRDHFDPFGSIIASRWCQWQLPLRDDQLVSAGDVTDQAAAAANWVAQSQALQGTITLGVTNEELIPPLEFEMRQIGVATYRELGWSLSQTPAGRLLELLTTHLAQQSWQSLAALVRHADVFAWIDRELAENGAAPTGGHKHWLTQMDEWLANHYPTRLSITLPDRAKRSYPQAVLVAERVQASLVDFAASGGERSLHGSLFDHLAPISTWAQKLKQWLSQIFFWDEIATDSSATDDGTANRFEADVVTDEETDEADIGTEGTPAERRGRVALRACWRSLERLAELDAAFDVPVNVSTGLELIIGRLLDQRIGDVATDDKLTIAGWLDLALEDSPSLAVVGLNHPYVPESVTADPFLPGTLRTRLQMSDNQRRLGRDIYALQLILATRQNVQLIVGRSGADGSPTPPSRLLAAAAPEDVARRVVHLLHDDALQKRQAAEQGVRRKWDQVLPRTELPIPKLAGDFDWQRDLPALSVTSFSAYRECPYRFYLRHVRKLRPLDDAQRELAANQFGDLMHNSLEKFGESVDKDSEDEKRVYEAMSDALETFTHEYYGSSPAAAVRLQIAQARKRLGFVAQQQVLWRRQGWQIWKVEAAVGEHNHAAITVDNVPMTIRGRFDRIDHHPSLGRWAILDYKTHGHPPRKKHLRKIDGKDQWVDLQLPIYRWMIPFLVGDEVDPETVELGYFNISDKAEETRINLADFSTAEFELANQQIIEVIRDIRAGRFEPSTEPVMYDDYAMIMQSQIADQLFGGDEHEI